MGENTWTECNSFSEESSTTADREFQIQDAGPEQHNNNTNKNNNQRLSTR